MRVWPRPDGASAALGEHPGDDACGNAITITPPVTVSGTTRGSTIDADEPLMCQGLLGSVWYQFQGASTDPMLVRLRAAEVLQRTRSQLASVACDATDSDGNAAVRFTPVTGGIYLIRVGQRFNSAPGDFTLIARTGQELSRRIDRGRYFVAVRTLDGGAGRYTLRRVSRRITSTRVTVEGSGNATVEPGRTVSIATRVSAAVAGPVTVTIERLDPLAGWQFMRELRTRASGRRGRCDVRRAHGGPLARAGRVGRHPDGSAEHLGLRPAPRRRTAPHRRRVTSSPTRATAAAAVARSWRKESGGGHHTRVRLGRDALRRRTPGGK